VAPDPSSRTSEGGRRPDLDVRALTPSRFADVIDLFGTRGDPSWCWCQFFVTTGGDYTRSADVNREALRAQASRRPRPGLVAYADGTPVGWVQVGPRPGFARLTGSRALGAVAGDDLDDRGVWAVTCFVVKVGHRRRGIGAALLGAAVAHARNAGAHTLEGHPVDVAARERKSSSSELYHGTLSTFLAAGFEEVGRTGPTRPVVRLALG
jgi:ribosomal protein S18 acetylase RimI-like enzyme